MRRRSVRKRTNEMLIDPGRCDLMRKGFILIGFFGGRRVREVRLYA